MRKQLIVTADDFGLTQRINEAIIHAHRNGIVTTASMMVNAGAFESAVEMARANPRLDIGLHLNLAHKPGKFALALVLGRVSTLDIEREVRHQIESALQTGLPISHIDGHKHIHAIPKVAEILRNIAPTYGIRAIRPLHGTAPSLVKLLTRNSKSRAVILKQYAMATFVGVAWAACWRGERASSFLTPTDFYGITETGFLDLSAFAAIIEHIKPGVHEVMCHPGYVDDDLRRTPTRLLEQRERELELLTSPELRNLIESAGIELVSYRALNG